MKIFEKMFWMDCVLLVRRQAGHGTSPMAGRRPPPRTAASQNIAGRFFDSASEKEVDRVFGSLWFTSAGLVPRSCEKKGGARPSARRLLNFRTAGKAGRVACFLIARTGFGLPRSIFKPKLQNPILARLRDSTLARGVVAVFRIGAFKPSARLREGQNLATTDEAWGLPDSVF